MAKLFGFSIEDSQDKSTSIVSPVPKNNALRKVLSQVGGGQETEVK